MTEIHEGVYVLRDGNVFVYLVKSGEEGLLVDAGFEPTARRIALELASTGVKRLGRIVLTHGHGDHYEGCAELRRRYGSEICIHPDDARLIGETGDAPLFRELDRAWPGLFAVPGDARPAAPASTLLREGDEVSVGERKLQVLHTPGHSEGSICLHEEASGLLFSGDTVSGDFVHFYCEPDVLDATLARLEGAELGELLLAHPYPPERTNSLAGGRARAFIARSRQALAAARGRVARRLEETPSIAPQALAKELGGPTLISVIRMMEAVSPGASRPAP